MVHIDLISEEMLSSMTSYEKIRMILDGVKNGRIIVLEKGLSPVEETKLIEATMVEISSDFVGIEMESYPSMDEKSIFSKLFRRSKNPKKITIIGSPNQIKNIEKNKGRISALISEI
ncbi:MAG: DUF2073 domain-containing protein [Candidatus Methanoliparum thermophilum]|uniref:DUF2073 domain-containing protein n=1 Tax=Methanoliparum thermophilum TaxID=2491083 RepID=A0A520KTY3_METT2|nr:DUF2073 domain-containing protein [Candidatus Methanoliparum sp. LAM-1]RZN65376.1 MAG: DUF2073 domain-containing protein [Candidatus Methanoliparum thermophilum]BDC35538.1 hypothetical protein MTLP_02200 [Candidatus Methanoliparum sp. LAM-1]